MLLLAILIISVEKLAVEVIMSVLQVAVGERRMATAMRAGERMENKLRLNLI